MYNLFFENRNCDRKSARCFLSKVFLQEVPSRSIFSFRYHLTPCWLQQSVYTNTVSAIFICSSQSSLIISFIKL